MCGCLEGVGIGDRLGEPWETKTPEEILVLNDGPITGPPTGPVTDDWNLTRICMESLLRKEGFDLLDLAVSHLREMEKGSDGWGETTFTGIQEILLYFNSRGADGRSPIEFRSSIKSGRGRGNGVAMKVAPFVLWHIITNPWLFQEPHPDKIFQTEELRRQIHYLGGMTHPDLQAGYAAYGLAIAIGSALLQHPSVVESKERRASWILTQICNEAHGSGPKRDFAYKMKELLDFDLLFGDIDSLRKAIGTGGDSLESVPFAIAVYLRNSEDFQAGILEAVNAGGDTDTIASMVGAMIGANVGLGVLTDQLPDGWILEESEASQLVAHMYELATRLNSSPILQDPILPEMEL